MNPVRKQRLFVVLAVLAGQAVAVGLAVYALRQNINLFYTPQQIVNGEAPVGAKMRVGGLVEDGFAELGEFVDGLQEFGASGADVSLLATFFAEGQGQATVDLQEVNRWLA